MIERLTTILIYNSRNFEAYSGNRLQGVHGLPIYNSRNFEAYSGTFSYAKTLLISTIVEILRPIQAHERDKRG